MARHKPRYTITITRTGRYDVHEWTVKDVREKDAEQVAERLGFRLPVDFMHGYESYERDRT